MALTESFKQNIQNPSSSVGGGIQSGQAMNDEQFSQWAQPSTSSSKFSPSSLPIVKDVKNFAGYSNDILDKTTAPLTEAAKNVTEDVKSSTEGKQNPLSAGVDVAGDVAGGVAKSVGGAIDSAVIQPLGKLFGNAPGMETIANSKYSIASALLDKLDSASKVVANTWNHFVETNPNAAKKVADAGNIAQFMALFAGDNPEVAKKVGSIVDTSVKAGTDLGEKVVAGGKKVNDFVTNTTKGAEDTVGNAADILKEKIGGKTKADILATPEEDVHKLSKPERDFYYKSQTEQVNQKAADVETKVKENLKAKTDASLKQIQDLNTEVEKTAYNKTLELKPKAVKAFGEQSRAYRALREEDMAPFKDTTLSHSEVSNALDKTFPDNPEIAQAMKAKLGLDTETPGWTNMTIGDLDAKMTELKGDLGSAAKKGNRVYTPEELNTDRALQGMNNLLKEKGVDLSRSNQFWREWAPLRDKIINKLKPFDVGGYETKTFSNIIKNSAQEGGDIHNEKFISAIEDTLGQSITKETKSALQKVTDVEKQQIADKIDAEMKIQEAQLEKERATKKLSDQQFETERKALQRGVLKKILYTAGGLGVDKIIKKYTGIGI